jgi:hypothetical protein
MGICWNLQTESLSDRVYWMHHQQRLCILLKDGVKIYGGFIAGTSDFSLRNPKTNVSVLSGDLNGDGTLNTYHVIITVSDGAGTVLDGFTIRGGKANVSSTITVESRNISREGGGGLFGINSSPTFNNCVFTVNEGTYGGGLNLSSDANPAFSDCLFYKNTSVLNGGAGVIQSSEPIFDHCIFEQNSSASVGGAFYVGNAYPEFTRSVFSKNSSGSGGVFFCSASSSNGYETCLPVLNNCIIIENSAVSGGFAYTTAASMFPNYAYSGISVANSIFYKNSGGGTIITSTDAFRTSASVSYVNNSIIWGNIGNNMFVGGSTNVYNCLQQPESNPSGTGNAYGDPQFTDATDPDGPDNIWGTEDDGLQPGYCSPAIDFSYPDGSGKPDILGRPVFNTLRDVGCYERQTPSCQVYASTEECQNFTISNVKQSRWYRVFSSDGIIAEINPNGLDLGTVTFNINDADGVINLNSKNYLGRTVNITSSNYASGATMPSSYKLRIYYHDSELSEYNLATSSSYMPSNFNMSWQNGGSGCTLAAYDGTTGGWVASSGISNGEFGTGNNGFFLEFALNHFTLFSPTTSGGSPLPVTLISFTGKNEVDRNVLEWRTSSETNNDHFYVERSKNGRNFEKIGETIAGAGTLKTAQSYSFSDRTFTSGTNYYRLKQVDIDSTVTPSRMIVIQNKMDKILFPNPVHDELFLTNQKTSFIYHIVDLSGKEIKRGESYPDLAISVKELRPGTYLIKFGDQVLKFVKE